eukprot:915265-Heterocapsa_arctica.AAC.1
MRSAERLPPARAGSRSWRGAEQCATRFRVCENKVRSAGHFVSVSPDVVAKAVSVSGEEREGQEEWRRT